MRLMRYGLRAGVECGRAGREMTLSARTRKGGKARMLRSFQQFWGKGVPQKVVVIAVAGVLVTCSCCGLGAVVLAAIGASLGTLAQPVQTVSTRTVEVQGESTPTHTTTIPTSTPTRQTTATA